MSSAPVSFAPQSFPIVPLRSVLFVPAANGRALEKSRGLGADALIFDLEDSAAPGEKASAREALRAHLTSLSRGPGAPRRIVRINGAGSEDFTEDLLMARGAASVAVDAILLPKVESAEDVRLVDEVLGETDAPDGLALWAMIETPRGILSAAAIAAASARLEGLIVGPNDIVAATGITLSPGRPELTTWMAQIVLAAKAHGLAVLDGVYNDFGDAEGFAAEARAARAMGFDGKTLIHPSQIAAANLAFGPSEADIEAARAIVSAFALPENAGKGVIRLDGRMVERLHLSTAERLIAFAAAIERSKTRTVP